MEMGLIKFKESQGKYIVGKEHVNLLSLNRSVSYAIANLVGRSLDLLLSNYRHAFFLTVSHPSSYSYPDTEKKGAGTVDLNCGDGSQPPPSKPTSTDRTLGGDCTGLDLGFGFDSPQQPPPPPPPPPATSGTASPPIAVPPYSSFIYNQVINAIFT
ncbi:hypothetical protein CR513_36904, partial [Mucuna pruriens]